MTGVLAALGVSVIALTLWALIASVWWFVTLCFFGLDDGVK